MGRTSSFCSLNDGDSEESDPLETPVSQTIRNELTNADRKHTQSSLEAFKPFGGMRVLERELADRCDCVCSHRVWVEESVKKTNWMALYGLFCNRPIEADTHRLTDGSNFQYQEDLSRRVWISNCWKIVNRLNLSRETFYRAVQCIDEVACSTDDSLREIFISYPSMVFYFDRAFCEWMIMLSRHCFVWLVVIYSPALFDF